MTLLPYSPPALELSFGNGSDSLASQRSRMQASRETSPELPTASQVFAEFEIFRPATSVFVAGSVVMGWGHGTSDIDLYVMLPEALDGIDGGYARTASTTDPMMYIVLGQFGAFRADIEVWTVEQVNEIINRFEDLRGPAMADRGEQDLLNRLVTGRPLHGEPWWARARDRITSSSYAMWLAGDRRRLAEAAVESARAESARGSALSSLLIAREALARAVEAALTVRGDFSVSRKWLYRRMQSTPLEGIDVDATWRRLCLDDAERSPDRWTATTLALCAQIMDTPVDGVRT